ncbi:MAG: hypothetical protein CVV06_08695 [Gammaproteobacteria bacterium HGW-Gammaproteobacteria-10]|nr:MAG: hypothetical protein CVV06_08695 [Gammaproteobacteria bacterium HGW-Gammaproteobacteria-10]
MANFMKVWGVASEDVGSRDCCRQAPMDGFTVVLDRHIPYLIFLRRFFDQKGVNSVRNYASRILA